MHLRRKADSMKRVREDKENRKQYNRELSRTKHQPVTKFSCSIALQRKVSWE